MDGRLLTLRKAMGQLGRSDVMKRFEGCQVLNCIEPGIRIVAETGIVKIPDSAE